MTRAALVSGAFVELAEALVGEYDVLDLLRTLVDQCVVLLDASASGILSDFGGDADIRVTSEQADEPGSSRRFEGGHRFVVRLSKQFETTPTRLLLDPSEHLLDVSDVSEDVGVQVPRHPR